MRTIITGLIITGFLCLSVFFTTGCDSKRTTIDSSRGTERSNNTAIDERFKDAPPAIKALLSDPNAHIKKIEETTPGLKTTHLKLFGFEDTSEEHGWDKEAIQYMEAFRTTLENDPDTARPLLSKVANARFGTHPLTDEWTSLMYQMAAEGQVSLLDVKRFCELERDLLTATNVEGYSKGIRAARGAIAQFDIIIAMMENNGTDPSQIDADVHLSDLK